MNINKKPTILIYSDCYTFGGSEYVVVNILKSKKLNESFNFMFAYRFNKEYYAFVNKLFSKEEQRCFYPLKLLSTDSLFTRISSYTSINKYIRYIILRALKSYDTFIKRFSIDEYFNNRQIRRFLLAHQGQIDAIHINNGGYPAAKSCLLFAICSREVGIKAFMQVNNCAVETTTKCRLDCDVEDSVSFFLTASDYCRKALSNNRKFDISKIITLHNSVETPVLNKNKEDVLTDLGISSNAYVVSEVALLEYRKGQAQLLEALMILKNKNIEIFDRIVLVLVGDGPEEARLRKFIVENDLSDKVLMLGYRLDYIDIINASDVYVLPSLCYEDMPLSILSAMALSKPIVSTNIAGIPEEVADGINGYLVDPNKESFIDDLSENLAKIYYCKDIMGSKSFEIYRNEFARDRYENKMGDLYKSMIDNK